MSLFEIEIPTEFKTLNSFVFLDEQELEKFYKLNNLNDGYRDDVSKYFLKDFSLKVFHDLFVMHEYRYELDEISNIIKSEIYTLNKDSDEKIFYPEWVLFYIAIYKKQVPFVSEKEFLEYLELFKYIAEIRYKKYIIRNVKNFICYTKYNQISSIQETLRNQLMEYIDQSGFTTEKLYEYLNFLYLFHTKLKDNEKYKLMWNIETYIVECIRMMLDNKVEMEEIYLEVYKGLRGTYSVLHEIYPYKPLFIKESSHFFQSHLSKINSVLEEKIDIEELMNILTRNSIYEDILFSYIELLKRFNAVKMNEILVGSLIKTVVLGIEEIILKKFNSDSLFDCLKKFKVGSHKFFELQSKIRNNGSNEEFFEKLNALILNEEDSLEKYLMTYYHSRNYLAHNNIDMNKFFWGEDGKRIVIATVIDSIMIILYKLEKGI